MLKQRNAWSGEKSQLDSLDTPMTPDSGVAPSLGDSCYSDTVIGNRQAEGNDSPSSSSRESHSTSCNEDVFDGGVEKMSKQEEKTDLRYPMFFF